MTGVGGVGETELLDTAVEEVEAGAVIVVPGTVVGIAAGGGDAGEGLVGGEATGDCATVAARVTVTAFSEAVADRAEGCLPHAVKAASDRPTAATASTDRRDSTRDNEREDMKSDPSCRA